MHNLLMDQESPDVYVFRLTNLKTILAALKRGGKKRLSEKMGGGQNYLSQVESKSNREGLQNIGYDLARSIETAAKELGLEWVHKGWMDILHVDGEQSPARVAALPANPVRVVTWMQAGGIESMDGADIDDAKTVNAPYWAGKGTFALEVRGDSMTNPLGMPSFPAGTIIIVDPGRKPKDGSAIIIKLPDVEEPVFKVLEFYDGKKQLKPLNPRYDIKPYPDGARVVGVVISMYYELESPEP